MTEAEQKALAQVEQISDPTSLRRMVENARGKSEVVERAAFRRLIESSVQHASGTVEYDCWSMVHAVEELRRAAGRKVSRMNRMRPKIAKEGEIAALEYCALQETDGFAEILAYGMPELTAEAIVLRHPTQFSERALAAARTRLAAHGAGISE